MESPNFILSIKHAWHKTKSLFESRTRSPDFIWHVLLWFFALTFLSTILLGYGAYGWANDLTTEDIGTDAKPERNILNKNEIISVLERYAERKAKLGVLISDRPTYPSPGKGSGIPKPVPPVEIKIETPEPKNEPLKNEQSTKPSPSPNFAP